MQETFPDLGQHGTGYLQSNGYLYGTTSQGTYSWSLSVLVSSRSATVDGSYTKTVVVSVCSVSERNPISQSCSWRSPTTTFRQGP